MTAIARLPVSVQTLYADLVDRAWMANLDEVIQAGGTPYTGANTKAAGIGIGGHPSGTEAVLHQNTLGPIPLKSGDALRI